MSNKVIHWNVLLSYIFFDLMGANVQEGRSTTWGIGRGMAGGGDELTPLCQYFVTEMNIVLKNEKKKCFQTN